MFYKIKSLAGVLSLKYLFPLFGKDFKFLIFFKLSGNSYIIAGCWKLFFSPCLIYKSCSNKRNFFLSASPTNKYFGHSSLCKDWWTSFLVLNSICFYGQPMKIDNRALWHNGQMYIQQLYSGLSEVCWSNT